MIQSQLIPMLAMSKQLDATTLVDGAWDVVAPFVELSTAELDYVKAVGRGESRPEILFPQDATLARLIETHPAVRWKVQNARKHRQRESLD